MPNSIPANGRTITQPDSPDNDLDRGKWRHVSDEAAKVVAKAQERAARKERAE